MKLRTSLQVSAIYPILLGIMVSLSLILRARHVGEAEHALRSAESLNWAAADLHLATYESLLTRNRETQGKWMATFDAMSVALGAVPTESVAGQILLERSQGCLKRLKETYAEFLKAAGENAKPDSPLTTQLVTDSGGLMKNARELARMASGASEETQSSSDLFFSVFIGIMGLLMAAATLSISRDALGRVGKLGQWARSVAGGNLDAKVGIQMKNDEVGDLVQAFSEMTKKLASACAAVESVAADHKKAADASRESNAMLSNAMERLRRAQQQIIQQERVTVLRQTLGGVVHDFSNTLTPIVTMSEFLLTYPEKAADTRVVLEIMNTIHGASRRAWKDLDKLAAVFNPSKMAANAVVDMNSLAVDVIRMLEPRWKEAASARGVLIMVETALAQVPPVSGDGARLKEALSSLVLNAVEALPRGGRISVRTYSSDDTVSVEIRDTGVGMSEQVRLRCLEPFFSTKGAEGTGMGLTNVQSTVRDLGGGLKIDSAEGKGTTVTISLPKWVQMASEWAPPLPPARLAKSLRILVVDDEPWVREVVAKVLQAEGHHVDDAGTGRAAMEKLEAGAYSLVITDRAMPDVSGDDLAVQIKQKWPGLPVIMLTGFAGTMLSEKEKPEGVDVVLGKPVARAELLNAIAEAMTPEQ